MEATGGGDNEGGGEHGGPPITMSIKAQPLILVGQEFQGQ